MVIAASSGRRRLTAIAADEPFALLKVPGSALAAYAEMLRSRAVGLSPEESAAAAAAAAAAGVVVAVAIVAGIAMERSRRRGAAGGFEFAAAGVPTLKNRSKDGLRILALENGGGYDRRHVIHSVSVKIRAAAAAPPAIRIAAAVAGEEDDDEDEAELLRRKIIALEEENAQLRQEAAQLDALHAQLQRAAAKAAEIAGAEVGGDIETSLDALEKLVGDLRAANAELLLRLDSAENFSSSLDLIIDADIADEERQLLEEADEGAGAAGGVGDDEAEQLREANERLEKEMEELRSSHCAHVEELVYLKWLNACLRHELRSAGRPPAAPAPAAVELSRSMSHGSSERARQLLLAYGAGSDAGAELMSPLSEPPAREATVTAGRRRKNKFFAGLKKLIAGTGRRRSSKIADVDTRREDVARWAMSHTVYEADGESTTPTSNSADLTPRMAAGRLEELQPWLLHGDAEEDDEHLKKYAAALKMPEASSPLTSSS